MSESPSRCVGVHLLSVWLKGTPRQTIFQIATSAVASIEVRTFMLIGIPAAYLRDRSLTESAPDFAGPPASDYGMKVSYCVTPFTKVGS